MVDGVNESRLRTGCIASLTRIRLYCDFALKLGGYGQNFEGQRSYCTRPLRLYTPSRANFWASPLILRPHAKLLAYTRHYAITTVYSVVSACVSVVRSYLRRVQSYDISAVVAIFVGFIPRP